MKTTLNKIRAHSPCGSGWEKLLKNLGKTKADDEPLALTTIFESNGIDDALWSLRAVDGHKREMRLFAVECARSVQHLMTDKRSIDALDVAERFANGLATQAELDAAWDAARAARASADAAGAAWDAARAAGAAARAAWASADAAGAAWDAARAAGAAADAAWDAARAAGAAARAAWDAARAADAAGAAAWAAWDAARAAGAAARAAWDAQVNLFILMCEGAL